MFASLFGLFFLLFKLDYFNVFRIEILHIALKILSKTFQLLHITENAFHNTFANKKRKQENSFFFFLVQNFIFTLQGFFVITFYTHLPNTE